MQDGTFGDLGGKQDSLHVTNQPSEQKHMVLFMIIPLAFMVLLARRGKFGKPMSLATNKKAHSITA
jgi:hypothetical protein